VDTQIRNTSGFANNLWVQMAVLVIAVGGLIALAAKFIWWQARSPNWVAKRGVELPTRLAQRTRVSGLYFGALKQKGGCW